ncbi:MAG TPA: SDR family NAD(P)-dependent oxidoreductase [Gaiellaceae bacterium]|nr:SDR family NAD(P)-dependent oxidoreductase [Gaiellaceae bacterium]
MAKKRGPVVVTGTSTGIGEATAIRLAEAGFQVFAGVRREADGAALRKKAEVTPVIVDITDESSVSGAAETIAKAVGDRGLAGLVNNAGVAIPAPIEFQPLADFRRQLEVNLIGHVAVIQAFLPLIRRGGGRIVNIGSVGGLLVLPLNGAYSASKFGLEALSDALRLELRQWGIHVSHVDVGPVHSAIFGKTYAQLDGLEKTIGEDGYRLYEAQAAGVRSATEKAEASADPPTVIAKAVFKALTSDKPKTRYLAGHGVKGIAAAAKLPDRAKDRAVAKEMGLPSPEAG